MQLADLKTGMIVITRNHKIFYVLRDILNGGCIQNILWNHGDWIFFNHYNDDLTCRVDYDEDGDFLPKDPTPTEIRNSRRRARYFAKAHEIVKVCIPATRDGFLSYDPETIKVLWAKGDCGSAADFNDNQDFCDGRDSHGDGDGHGEHGAQDGKGDLHSHDDLQDQDYVYLRKGKWFSFPSTIQREKATLSDLRTGMVVTLRNGNQYVVMRNMCDADFHCEDILWSKCGCISLFSYNADMNYAIKAVPSDYHLDSADTEQVNESVKSPFDIVEVYLSKSFYDFHKKRNYDGEILWRNEPAAITYRRFILDVPPCQYTEVPFELHEIEDRPAWIPKKEWDRIVASGELDT